MKLRKAELFRLVPIICVLVIILIFLTSFSNASNAKGDLEQDLDVFIKIDTSLTEQGSIISIYQRETVPEGISVVEIFSSDLARIAKGEIYCSSYRNIKYATNLSLIHI